MSDSIKGNYYLVAIYKEDNKPHIIPIKQSWYLKNGANVFSRQNDLSAIDLVTTSFDNITQMKERMFKNNYLASKEVDLFIVNKNVYNKKTYINESEMIFGKNYGSKRLEVLNNIGQKKIKHEPINLTDTSVFIDSFLAKCYNKKSFYMFMTSYCSSVDDYFKDKLLEIGGNPKSKYFGVKYGIKSKLTSYSFIRNIISMWLVYDSLKTKYEGLEEISLGKEIIKDYEVILKERNMRKIYYPLIEEKIDKNYIEGQLKFTEDLDNKPNISKIPTVVLEPQDSIQRLLDLTNRLKEKPFDLEKLNELFSKYGPDCVSLISDRELNSLSLDDRFKLGLVGDVLEYLNQKEKQENFDEKYKRGKRV